MTSYPTTFNSVRLLERPAGICWVYSGPDFSFKFPGCILDALKKKSNDLTPEGKAKFDAACASTDLVSTKPDSKGRRWITGPQIQFTQTID